MTMMPMNCRRTIRNSMVFGDFITLGGNRRNEEFSKPGSLRSLLLENELSIPSEVS